MSWVSPGQSWAQLLVLHAQDHSLRSEPLWAVSSGESSEDWQGTTEASISAMSSMSRALIVSLKQSGKVKYARQSNRLPVLSVNCSLRVCRLVYRNVP